MASRPVLLTDEQLRFLRELISDEIAVLTRAPGFPYSTLEKEKEALLLAIQRQLKEATDGE